MAAIRRTRRAMLADRLDYVWGLTRASIREQGFRHAARSMAVYSAALLRSRRIARRRFTFRNRTYPYFSNLYKMTWNTERAVEIPIARAAIEAHPAGRILEVGNVLSHYFPVGHEVVDKYEQAPGVLNQDVVAFQPDHRYDLIVSISTLEHVGWDEAEREPQKTLRAVAHLRSLLAPGGQLLITFPVGYNPWLDAFFWEDRLPFDEITCLQRVTRDNRWAEVEREALRGTSYNAPFFCANGLVIGTSTAAP